MTAFEPLFVPPALRDAVSGRAWLASMLEAERALARASAAAGLVPEPAAVAIAEACAPGDLDWEALLADGRASGTPVEPLVRTLVARVGEAHARFIHFGATSQDVMDTAAMLVARSALDLVVADLGRVAAACERLAREHAGTPMAARTLLQHAVPTTFGLKAAGWLVAVGDARARLEELRRTGLAAQLGGAAGTLAAYGDKGLEVAALYARELGLAEPVLPWHANRLRVAELGAALEIGAGVLAKIALDVVLLAQTEVAEVREGGDGGTSSAMPQKRNPIGAMRTRACAEAANGHASVLRRSLASEHERAAGAWQAEWNALAGALAATGGAAASLAETVERLEVDADRMRTNLELTGGAIAAERLAARLSVRLGRAEARKLVRDAALRSADTGRPFAEVVGELGSGLDKDEIDAALDPTTYVGAAVALIERAVTHVEETA